MTGQVMPSHDLGREAEILAEGLLARSGLSVVERNLRIGPGELDLVAREGSTLVFVEVKSQSRAGFGRAEERVDKRKRARLVAAAEAYLARLGRLGGPPPPCRFDVVAVDYEPGGARLRHLRDAFRPGD
jgi:putative endonuclease